MQRKQVTEASQSQNPLYSSNKDALFKWVRGSKVALRQMDDVALMTFKVQKLAAKVETLS